MCDLTNFITDLIQFLELILRDRLVFDDDLKLSIALTLLMFSVVSQIVLKNFTELVKFGWRKDLLHLHSSSHKLIYR